MARLVLSIGVFGFRICFGFRSSNFGLFLEACVADVHASSRPSWRRLQSAAAPALASARQRISGWFGETPPPEPTAAARETPAAREGETYYAAVEGLTVYAEPSESSKVVGHLALHEKVIRSRLERGYAYVTVSKSGLDGWVDNGQLLWRVPASAASGAADRAEPIEGLV
jgi:hypothetical protein